MSLDPSTAAPTPSVAPADPPRLQKKVYAPRPVPTEAEQSQTEARLRARGLQLLGGTGGRWQDRTAQIERWWSGMKAAERTLTWDSAFAANRVCARGINTKPAANLGGYILSDPTDAPTAQGRRQERILLWRDPDGILARTIPLNFQHAPGHRSQKNTLGLHALSASLVDRRIQIKEQLKPYEGGIYAFFPVPTEDDMQVFEAISQLPGADQARLIEMRSMMTRIECAAPDDMHTHYTYLPSDAGPLVRYGMVGVYPDTSPDSKSPVVRASAVELRARRTNASEYSRLLGQGATTNVSEIVVSFRRHESPWFPLFAEWDAGTQSFHVGMPEASDKYLLWWLREVERATGETDGKSAAAHGVVRTHTLRRSGARITNDGRYVPAPGEVAPRV